MLLGRHNQLRAVIGCRSFARGVSQYVGVRIRQRDCKTVAAIASNCRSYIDFVAQVERHRSKCRQQRPINRRLAIPGDVLSPAGIAHAIEAAFASRVVRDIQTNF